MSGYRYGTLLSPVFNATYPFDTAIASWDATTPVGTWVQVELRAYRPSGNHWTKYYNMGIWTAKNGKGISRHSVGGQGNADGYVATDTLLLYGQPRYTKYQYRLTLFTTDTRYSPRVSLIAVTTSNSYKEPNGPNIPSDRQAWGVDLRVPQRSQMIYPNGGEAWCSPTSTSMILAYWGHNVTVPYAAASTYDSTYRGNGNWPFNTAFASTYGLESYVTRMSSMSQIEDWIRDGIPVAISIGFSEGELPGAPIASSNGHLIVVRGFDRSGNVIVNDPAGPYNSAVRRVYNRGRLEKLWLEHSGGTVYLIYPKGHARPAYNYSQVVDNSTAGRFSASGNWGWSNWNRQRYGSNYRYTTHRSVTDLASYKFRIPANGNYSFYAWYPADRGYNSHTPIRIHTSSGWRWVYANQTGNGGRWVYLGTFPMNAGDNWNVQVSRWIWTQGYIVADAFKVVSQQ